MAKLILKQNKAMQEPLEKLYQYDNQPNMRKKIKEYIRELETEIKRIEDHLEERIYLIERNKIDIYAVADKLFELYNKELPIPLNKHTCHSFFDRVRARHICKAVILLDNEDGLSNWDNCEAESLEDAIDMLDAGYGILPLVG
ncbi:hypothetical protein DW272_01985 [Blautia obeum]|uniref:Uncharacterized protein n=1 Tax=Blautia obeum TaxID=40520 RepID=A0A414SK90_9FIRM|nr:hypothetical protein [Blautia obeum]RHG19998.1 hypothetical protein DW272_01985 [Blautia obeum]